MADLERAEIEAAQQEKRQRLTLRTVFDDIRPHGLEGRRSDLPTANEVAIVYVGEDESERLKWQTHIAKAIYSWILATRQNFNAILYAGKLLQQFAVDSFMKIEQNRLNYHRTHQTDYRTGRYQGLQDFMLNDCNGNAGLSFF